jgi:hypothetical protein
LARRSGKQHAPAFSNERTRNTGKEWGITACGTKGELGKERSKAASTRLQQRDKEGH